MIPIPDYRRTWTREHTAHARSFSKNYTDILLISPFYVFLRTIAKKKILNIFWGAFCKRKKKYFDFLSLIKNKIKEDRQMLQKRVWKRKNIFFFFLEKKKNLPISGLQSTFSKALHQVKKQYFKMKLWNWGPITVWHNFTQKLLHPTL